MSVFFFFVSGLTRDSCVSFHKPQCLVATLLKVTWLKDGQLINPDDDKNLMIDYKGSLVIRVARLKDAGKYTCMAENIVETRRSQPAKIDVHIDGMWGAWTSWSACSINEHSCIKGTKATHLLWADSR